MHRLFAFAALLILPPCMSALLAQRPGEVQLSKARADYEATMALVRERVLNEIKIDKGDVEVRIERRNRFIETGEWPTMPNNAVLAASEQSETDARTKMEAAYDACLEALFEEIGLTKMIRSEQDVWRGVNDLISWIEVKVPSGEAGKPTGRVTPVVVPCKPKCPYRIEVRGKGATCGPVWLQLPGTDRSLGLVVAADGSFHAMVTVSASGFAAADIGVLREAESSVPPMVGSEEGLLLAVDAVLEAVRWKPAPIDKERPAREAARKRAEEADRLAMDAATLAAVAEAERVKVEKLVAPIEKKKSDHLSRKPGLEDQLAAAVRSVDKLRAQVRDWKSRGHDTSDLESDLRSCEKKVSSCRRQLDVIDAQVAKIDEEIADLRAGTKKK